MNTEGQTTDFELSAGLAALRDETRAFAREFLAPHAAAWDRDAAFPRQAIAAAAARGYLGIAAAEEYGGSARGNLASCVMLEEINAACPSVGVTISVHNSLFCGTLTKWGTDEQRRRYLPKAATGEWLGGYSLSEAGAGSDAAALVCSATDAGDAWVLDGPKLWITTGSEAGAYIVFARTGEDRVAGISAFVVERGFDGVSIGKQERKLGVRASPTVELLLSNVRVPKANLVGEVGQGFKIALDMLDGGRLGIASQSIGIGRHAVELIAAHLAAAVDAKGRPTARQTEQWTLADLCTDLDAARLLTWRAATRRDRGLRCTAEAAMAKSKASRVANDAARAAVSVLGVTGADGSTDAERCLRDARITEIYEGATDIQRLVITRDALARRA